MSAAARQVSRPRRALMLGSLVFAGESIYMLPYALRRDYENAMLEAMHVSNTELGWLTSMFGVMALACYFPGGFLADRFSARMLLTFSLVSTGLGGLYMATFPGYAGLVALHAFWGVTTIMTFWGALIKATRVWGGDAEQGRAFGTLEGGRGLFAFVLAATGGLVFAGAPAAREGLRTVIVLYSGVVLVVAVLTWCCVPDDLGARAREGAAKPGSSGARARRLVRVLSMPVVWLQAMVILAAYAGYWGTFDLGKLAVDAYGATDAVGSAVSISAVFWRAVTAVAAGFLADRYGASRTVIAAFAVLFAGCALFCLAPTGASLMWLLWGNAAVVGAATYALRGVFYALLEEGRVPMGLTGLTVGVVSVVGYTPDIFVPPLKGWLLDSYPGALGHRYFFGILAAGAVVGAAAALGIRRVSALPVRGPARPDR